MPLQLLRGGEHGLASPATLGLLGKLLVRRFRSRFALGVARPFRLCTCRFNTFELGAHLNQAFGRNVNKRKDFFVNSRQDFAIIRFFTRPTTYAEIRIKEFCKKRGGGGNLMKLKEIYQ